MKSQLVRLKLTAFRSDLLSESINIIRHTFNNALNLKNDNLISVSALPTKKRIYCVLRAPHVYKDSREHFEIRTSTRIVEASLNYIDFQSDLRKILSDIKLPAGVFCNIQFK